MNLLQNIDIHKPFFFLSLNVDSFIKFLLFTSIHFHQLIEPVPKPNKIYSKMNQTKCQLHLFDCITNLKRNSFLLVLIGRENPFVILFFCFSVKSQKENRKWILFNGLIFSIVILSDRFLIWFVNKVNTKIFFMILAMIPIVKDVSWDSSARSKSWFQCVNLIELFKWKI